MTEFSTYDLNGLIDAVDGFGFGDDVAETKEEVKQYYLKLIKEARTEIDFIENHLDELINADWDEE